MTGTSERKNKKGYEFPVMVYNSFVAGSRTGNPEPKIISPVI
jgi:hypothetical protein